MRQFEMLKFIPLLTGLCGLGTSTQGAVWEFDLGGVAGAGLLGGNVVDQLPNSFASGREIIANGGSGITYDPIAKILSFQVGWGAHEVVQGTPLSGQYLSSALYGPAEISENSGNALYSFALGSGYIPANDPTGRTGFIDWDIPLAAIGEYSVAEQEADLRNSRWYFSINSTAYENGEIRGQLLMGIPEPRHSSLGAAAGLLLTAGWWRKKSQKTA